MSVEQPPKRERPSVAYKVEEEEDEDESDDDLAKKGTNGGAAEDEEDEDEDEEGLDDDEYVPPLGNRTSTKLTFGADMLSRRFFRT